MADELLILRSVHTDHFNHAPAQIFMNTGHTLVGRPSMGSWLTYGLGSESRDLPGFVVLLSGKSDPGAGSACWSSGFLPTAYQGVEFRPKGEPVLAVANPDGLAPVVRRRALGCFADHVHVRRRPQQHRETTAHERLVVDDGDTDHQSAPYGSVAVTANPPPALGPAENVPPYAATRSRMPINP